MSKLGLVNPTQFTMQTISNKPVIPTIILVKGLDEGYNIGSLFVKQNTEDDKKCGDNILIYSVILMPHSGQVLYLNNEYTLFMKKPLEEAQQIATDVVINSIKFSAKENAIIYRTNVENKESLYIWYLDQEKERLITDLSIRAQISNDGNIVIFNDTTNGNLYYKTIENEKIKLHSGVSSFIISGDGQTILYNKKEDDLYLRKIDQEESVKLDVEGTTPIDMAKFYKNGDVIFFLTDYISMKGELFYSSKDNQWKSHKIASDVISYAPLNENKVYILNEEFTLSLIDINSKNIERENISDDVVRYVVSGNDVVFTDEEANLYIRNLNGNKIKIGSDVDRFSFSNKKIVYVNADKDMYLSELNGDKKKIASDVITYSIMALSADSEIAILYRCNESEIYYLPSTSITDPILMDFSNYDSVIFNNNLIYEKKLTVDDILGTWQGERDIIIISENNKYKWYWDGTLNHEGEYTFESLGLASAYWNDKHIELVDNELFTDYGCSKYKRVADDQFEILNKLQKDNRYKYFVGSEVYIKEGTTAYLSNYVDVVGYFTKDNFLAITDAKIDSNGNEWVEVKPAGYYDYVWVIVDEENVRIGSS